MPDAADPSPSTGAVARQEPPAERLASEMRRIVARLALVRAPAEELERAADAAAAFADRLDELPERSTSWEISEAGLLPRDFVGFSPVSGARNPIAPPVVFSMGDFSDWGGADAGEAGIEGEVTFGPAYEGPPGHVHGGFVAAMFDELLGYAQKGPGFTATLTIRYRKPTPLNKRLALKAKVERVEGRKRWIRGTCELEGEVLSEAEGFFVAPRDDEDFLRHLGQA